MNEAIASDAAAEISVDCLASAGRPIYKSEQDYDAFQG